MIHRRCLDLGNMKISTLAASDSVKENHTVSDLPTEKNEPTGRLESATNKAPSKGSILDLGRY